MHESAIAHYAGPIAAVNFLIVALALIAAGWFLTRRRFTADVPEGRQNVAEWVTDFFFGKAREMGDMRVVRVVAPFLATFFLMILASNLLGVLPVPVLNNPPTAFFSVTLALALCSVVGTLVVSGVFQGIARTFKHLVWPNPLQLISEFTDVLSLSLRLFGNIGGEHMTVVLVSSAVAVGIPLILHVLGLIPAFVQALVFTLLTTSFVAGAIAHVEERERGRVAHEGASGVSGESGVEPEAQTHTGSGEALPAS